MATTSAASVAASMLERAAVDGEPVSNLKLQKLVTLVQSVSMFATSAPAFCEPVQAWKNGPAIKPLYGLYKRFGSDQITSVMQPWSGLESVSGSVGMMIDEVWDVAGKLSASDLWKLTHTVGPWEAHYSANTRDVEIPAEQLGSAWTDYLSCALKMATPQDQSSVIGRGQLGYEGEHHWEFASASFRPVSARESA
ncbi:Panacea domain-containing protein [Microbacterium binotii]|uniref:Panacea domain-containing protein n=1 Tax=Microbacterium binotii TaxID=462710 RepID=UPI001F18522E|nr:type II toxin-antitoxin system antitoxin SocA domain-containing protein [Microbacterium binotii]UIN30935.1 DUF4065 domain-containing protein [Microbacterium binotii]